MKYVALAALTVTYWLLVAIAHLVVEGDCSLPRERAAQLTPAVPCVAPAPELGVVPPPPVNPLRKMAFVSGMNAVKPLIARCFEVYRVPGLAMVSVVIAPGGQVSSATVAGRFAGSPTGACVEQAVLTARFPPSDGFATPYPFQLR